VNGIIERVKFKVKVIIVESSTVISRKRDVGFDWGKSGLMSEE